MTNLIVTAFKDGTVIRMSTKTPGWATIMVVTEELTVAKGGLLVKNSRNGFLKAEVAQIEALNPVAGADLNALFKARNIAPQKMVIVESLVPSYEGQQAKIHPKTNAPILSVNGEPIYYETAIIAASDPRGDTRIPSQKSVDIAAEAVAPNAALAAAMPAEVAAPAAPVGP